MKGQDRIRKLWRDRGVRSARALHTCELNDAGSARARALQEADRQLDRIARRLPEALAAGVTMADVARATGVSRQTLYELRGRYGSVADVRLAVLQAVACSPAATVSALAERLGRPEREVADILGRFEADDLVDFEVELLTPVTGGVELHEQVWSCTEAGIGALEGWTFAEAQE